MCSKKRRSILYDNNKNEGKTMAYKICFIFHATENSNSIVQHLLQIKSGIMKHVNVNVKTILSAKAII